MSRSSSLPTWTTPLLLVAYATDLFAERPPYDVFPPADPPYYRVRYEAGASRRGNAAQQTPNGRPQWIARHVPLPLDCWALTILEPPTRPACPTGAIFF